MVGGRCGCSELGILSSQPPPLLQFIGKLVTVGGIADGKGEESGWLPTEINTALRSLDP